MAVPKAVSAPEGQSLDGIDAHEARLREAIEALERGEGMGVSDADEAAIRREIEDLDRRNVDGGASPTLERLIREHQVLIHERRTQRNGSRG